MTLLFEKCTSKERITINKIINRIEQRIRYEEVPALLRNCIRAIIKGGREVIVCCEPEVVPCSFHRGAFIKSEKDKVEICPSYIGSAALFFHELVHVCGGNELDAEVMENVLFSLGEGAVKPSYFFDKMLFEVEGYKGKFVYVKNDGIYNSEARFLLKKKDLIDW